MSITSEPALISYFVTNGFVWVPQTRGHWRDLEGVRGWGDGEISQWGTGVQNRLKKHSILFCLQLSLCLYFIFSFSMFLSLLIFHSSYSSSSPLLLFSSSFSLSLSGFSPDHHFSPFPNSSFRLFWSFSLSILLTCLFILQSLFPPDLSLTKLDKELKVHSLFEGAEGSFASKTTLDFLF